MDPVATLREFDDAVSEHDWHQACQSARGLIQWARKKGFRPTSAGDWRSELTAQGYIDYLHYMLHHVANGAD